MCNPRDHILASPLHDEKIWQQPPTAFDLPVLKAWIRLLLIPDKPQTSLLNRDDSTNNGVIVDKEEKVDAVMTPGWTRITSVCCHCGAPSYGSSTTMASCQSSFALLTLDLRRAFTCMSDSACYAMSASCIICQQCVDRHALHDRAENLQFFRNSFPIG